MAPWPLAAPFTAAAAGLVLAGICHPFLNVPLTSYPQAVVPDEMRGNVLSVRRLDITGAVPIGIALAGSSVELSGPTTVLLGRGALIGLVGSRRAVCPLIRLSLVTTAAGTID